MPLSKKYGTYFEGFDADSTFEFYEAVRKRLPTASFPTTSRRATGLLEIADSIDVFVFDAYGVLNVGSTPIPQAAETVSALRKMGKQMFVLTNAATYPFEHSIQKFKSLGFDFHPNEIFSSRMGACNWITQQNVSRWGVMGKSDSIRTNLVSKHGYSRMIPKITIGRTVFCCFQLGSGICADKSCWTKPTSGGGAP